MLKLRRAAIALSIVVILALGIFCGVELSRWVRGGSGARSYDTVAVLQQVKTLSQLVTVQYVIEKVEVLEVPPESALGKMFAGNNRILLLAHGIVKAGINFERMKPEDLQLHGKSIRITLPHPQITDAYLDDKQTKVIEWTTGFLRAFDKDLEQTTREKAIGDIQRAARQSGILNDADERARAQLKDLLLRLGFDEVEFLPAKPSS